MSDHKSNKEIAVSFLKLASAGNVDEAYAKYVDLEFIHHNQYFKGDRQSLMSAMKENSMKMPNKSFEVKSVLGEGDRVVTYSKVKTESMEIAVFHMMRFKNDRIVEMWDAGQPISKDSPNKNGMF